MKAGLPCRCKYYGSQERLASHTYAVAQCSTENGFRLWYAVALAVGERVAVGITLKSKPGVDADVLGAFAQQILPGDLNNLSDDDAVIRYRSMSSTSPSSRYLAVLVAASNTPRALQLNL